MDYLVMHPLLLTVIALSLAFLVFLGWVIKRCVEDVGRLDPQALQRKGQVTRWKPSLG
jgi:hypothetical protein